MWRACARYAKGASSSLTATWKKTLSSAASATPPTTSNPLLGNIETANTKPKRFWAIAHYRNLPVSPKKLRVVANMAPRLFWKEAMMQTEFCRKNIAIFVKNAIQSAVGNAEHQGLDRNRLVVESVIVNKGSYIKRPDFKPKGRTGIRKTYHSHLRVTVREVPADFLKRTKGFTGRWSADAGGAAYAKLMAMPWEERVKQLPRYKPIEGYDPYN